VRDCTAVAAIESQLLVLTRKDIFEVIRRFPNLRREMQAISLERKRHHQRLIDAACKRYEERQSRTAAALMESVGKNSGSAKSVAEYSLFKTLKNNIE
jgi:CRP-like cAMP-binding protein